MNSHGARPMRNALAPSGPAGAACIVAPPARLRRHNSATSGTRVRGRRARAFDCTSEPKRIGKTVGEARSVQDDFQALMQGRGTVEPDEDVLEDGIAFAGVAKFPARVKCALLSWMAWKDATSRVLGTESKEQA